MVTRSFALPALPSLPSLPRLPSASSIRAFIDPEPQVFYPALPRSPSRSRIPRERRDSGSSTRSTSSGQYRTAGSPSHHGLKKHNHTGLGQLNGASRSAVDLGEGREGGAWVANSLKELGRRHSISLQRADSASDLLSPEFGPRPVAPRVRHDSLFPVPARPHTPSGSPSRPVHRRSRSALPGSAAPRQSSSNYAPLGRLSEFNRNPLTSSSAVSLPTLAEGETDDSAFDIQAAGQYSNGAHHRTCSRTSTSTSVSLRSPITPASPLSTCSMMASLARPISPLSLHSDQSFDSSDADGDAQDELDRTPRAKRWCPDPVDVPAPRPYASYSVPPPLPIARLRPPPSPRARSDSTVPTRRRIQSSGHIMPVSQSMGQGTAAVSDVSVVATWSCTSMSSLGEGGGSGEGQASDPSNRLREKLRSLSMLDTSVPGVPNDTAEDGNRSETTSQRTTPDQDTSSYRFPPTPPGPPGRSAIHTRASRAEYQRTYSSPRFLLSPPMSSDSATRADPGFPRPDAPSASPSATRSSSPGRPGHRRADSRLRSPQLLSLPLESGLQSTHDLHRSSSLPCEHKRRQSSPSNPQRVSVHPQRSYDSTPDNEDMAEPLHEGVVDPPVSMARLPALEPHPLVRTRSALRPTLPTGKGRWWQTRRYSTSGELTPTHQDEGEVQVLLKNSGAGGERRDMRGESPENERFIDFDDI